MNQELMPLIDECIELARHRRPNLSGMLAIQVGAAGDADLGAVVDDVRVADNNEIDDAELIECVQQSAFSLVLPAPKQHAREDLELTLPVGDDG